MKSIKIENDLHQALKVKQMLTGVPIQRQLDDILRPILIPKKEDDKNE